MSDERTANLLGALSLTLTDRLTEETQMRAERGAAAPAALISVGAAPGDSIDALSRTIGLTHSATVRLIDRLARDGLVERRSGADARSVSLYLTPHGAARRRGILQGRREVLTDALSPLSPQEQVLLTRLMETLLGALTQDRQDADHICRLCDEDACPQDRCPVECAVAKPHPKP